MFEKLEKGMLYLLTTGFFTYQMSKIVSYHDLKNFYNGCTLPEKDITKFPEIKNPYKLVIYEYDYMDDAEDKIDRKVNEVRNSNKIGFEFERYMSDHDEINILEYITNKGFYYQFLGSCVDVQMFKKK